MGKEPSSAPGARRGRLWMGQMSVSRLAGGFIALAIGAAVATALAANPDERPPPMMGVAANPDERPPPMMGVAAGRDANAATTPKSDRLAVRPAKSRPVTWACPAEPWPYGCQWRVPARKVLRPSRSS
jgi:hypothetical protein